jgi:hypothetical protein
MVVAPIALPTTAKLIKAAREYSLVPPEVGLRCAMDILTNDR